MCPYFTLDTDPDWNDTDLYFPEDDHMMDTSYISAEQRLMNILLRHYERSVRPVKKASDTVHVLMGLTLTQIFDMVSGGWGLWGGGIVTHYEINHGK